MLWIALNFPCLPLEACQQASAQSEPWAVADGPRVAVCNLPARNQGICAGMSLSAACALAPKLGYRQRDPKAETAALGQLAAWACQFTPCVALRAPFGLLLEIEGSLKLLGGIRRILETVKRETADMGYTLMLGCAPTATAAWLLARGGGKRVVSCQHTIASEISPLPVAVLDCSAQVLETLSAVGVRTIAEFLQLPRAGAARRFGQGLLDQLDRALGKLPEAHRFYSPPPHFNAALELGVVVASAEALLFAARRLTTQLAGYLAGRCGAIQRFTFALAHEDIPETVLQIELVTPTREAGRFITLLRDRLAAIALAAPVCRMRIEADEILALAGDTRNLFQDPAGNPGDWSNLIDRLRARLGADAVQGLSPHGEHRPELAWRATVPGAQPDEHARVPGPPRLLRPPRPLWLLEPPRPLKEVQSKPQYHDGPLALIAGPERIESGWWDGGDIKRDYFVAQTPQHSTLWIYRERQRAGGWYLHGIFG